MTNGQSSEVLGSMLVGGRDPVNKWIGKGGLRRARCNVLRKVAKNVTFLVHLQRDIMDMYLRKMDQYALEHPVVLVRRHLGHALDPGIHTRGSIARVIDQRRYDSRTAEVTDSKWLGMVVYDALIGYVDVVRILRSTWPSNTPDWRRYILLMTFRLAIGGSGSGRGLKDAR
jgi:hypothetical protein